MSNLSDLKTALSTAAATISNEIDRLDCLSDIDAWYACRTAMDALVAGRLVSYSIGGRSATKRDIPEMADIERQLRARIRQSLYVGGAAYADLRDPLETWSQT